jgi:hypothetical protein
LTKLDTVEFGPPKIARGIRTLAQQAHEAVRGKPKSRTVRRLLKRVHRFELRLMHYTESTGAPLDQLRRWVASLRRELLLHRDPGRV